MRPSACILLMATALLASCNPTVGSDTVPFKAYFMDGAPPDGARMGDRILASGYLMKTGNGFYALYGTARDDKAANGYCIRLEGTNRFWSPTRWRAASFADGKTVVIVPGRIAVPRPRIVSPTSRADYMTTCNFGMTVEGIDRG